MSYAIHRLLVANVLDIWMDMVVQVDSSRPLRLVDPGRFKAIAFLCIDTLRRLDAPVMVDAVFKDYRTIAHTDFLTSTIINRALKDAVRLGMIQLPSALSPHYEVGIDALTALYDDTRHISFELDWEALHEARNPGAIGQDFSIESVFRSVIHDVLVLDISEFRSHLVQYIIRLLNSGDEPDNALFEFHAVYHTLADASARRRLSTSRTKTRRLT